MKKIYGIFFAVVLVVLTAACAKSTASSDDDSTDNSRNTLPENCIMLDAGKWPQNEYTADIPQPESGTVSRGWIDPDNHFCSIDMTGVSSKAMENWYGLLLDNGFTEIERVAEVIKNQNYTSTNALLQKDGISISMTHLSTGEGNFGLCITEEK